MVHANHEQDGVITAGLLVVVERGTGAIRVAEAVMQGESPAAVFRDAFQAPAPPAKPGRPKHVVFEDPWLRDQVASVLEEAGKPSVTIAATPALDDALARLLQQAGAPVAPGIDRDFMDWRAALQELIRLAPWRVLDSEVTFSFVGGGLDSALATVTGKHGELTGVVLYPTRADLDSHRAVLGSGQLDGRLYSSVHLMLEPKSGLSANELESCMRVALQFPPGLYPKVYAFSPDGFAPASPVDQARLLSVVKAMAALSRADLDGLAAGGTRTTAVDGVQLTGSRA